MSYFGGASLSAMMLATDVRQRGERGRRIVQASHADAAHDLPREGNDGKDNDQDGSIDEDNSDPVPDAETLEIAEDGTLTIAATLLAGDIDPDGDALTVMAVSNAVNGTVSVADRGDGDASNDEVIFTPTPGYSGPASFDYTVADGFGGIATATVAVTDAPNVITRPG